MKIIGDKVIFSTGKELYANAGILGINSSLEVSEGSDGDFFTGMVIPGIDEGTLNKAEQIELSDFMIGLWNQFKQRAVSSV